MKAPRLRWGCKGLGRFGREFRGGRRPGLGGPQEVGGQLGRVQGPLRRLSCLDQQPQWLPREEEQWGPEAQPGHDTRRLGGSGRSDPGQWGAGARAGAEPLWQPRDARAPLATARPSPADVPPFIYATFIYATFISSAQRGTTPCFQNHRRPSLPSPYEGHSYVLLLPARRDVPESSGSGVEGWGSGAVSQGSHRPWHSGKLKNASPVLAV